MHRNQYQRSSNVAGQKPRTYRPLEKQLCKSLYSGFLKLQALNQISKETLMIHLPNERKSSTYRTYDRKGNKIEGKYDPFLNKNNHDQYNFMKQRNDMLYNKGLNDIGMMAGLLDYLIIKPIKFGFMEVKIGNGKLTPAQIWFLEYCDRNHIPKFILRGYEGLDAAYEFIRTL